MLPLLLLCAAAGPLEDAEAAVLRSDGQGALARLQDAEAGPRRLRLELDARVLEQDLVRAPQVAERLAQSPGWETHAVRQLAHLEGLKTRRWLSRTGLGMFALAIAMLAIGGARELLRPSLETAVAAVGLGLAVVLGRRGSPVFGEVLALHGAAILVVTHAAFATLRRTQPGARGKAVLMALVLLGVGGALLSTLTQVQPVEIVAQGLISSRG